MISASYGVSSVLDKTQSSTTDYARLGEVTELFLEELEEVLVSSDVGPRAALRHDFTEADEVDGSCSTRRRNAP